MSHPGPCTGWGLGQIFGHYGAGEAAAAAGRDPGRLTAACQLTASLDPDRARARRTALEFLNAYYGTSLPALEGSFWDRDAFGTPAECVERMAGLADAGVREFSVRFASPDQRGQLDLFTEAVVPTLSAG